MLDKWLDLRTAGISKLDPSNPREPHRIYSSSPRSLRRRSAADGTGLWEGRRRLERFEEREAGDPGR